MWKHWIVFLSVCVVNTDIFPAVCGTIPDITTLCPYNKFCKSTPKKIQKENESHLIPCCGECSCNPDCQLFGTCCPDKELMPSITEKYPCTQIDKYFNELREIDTYDSRELFYHLIDDCPNAALDLAYPRCTAITELEDYMIVSDPKTGCVYKNKHCARCHGIEDFVEWKLLTDCLYEQSYNFTVKEWHAYITEYCQIIPIPPDQTTGLLHKCTDEKNIIKECNKTGLWTTYNQEIKTACEQDNSTQSKIYTYEKFTNSFTDKEYYKNVYCMMCNTYQKETQSGLCQREKDIFEQRSRFSMTVIVSFKVQMERNDEKQEKCHHSQIWNPYKEVCLELKCPFTTVPYYGKCEDVYTHLPGETYIITFLLQSNENIYSHEVLELLEQMLTNFLQNPDCFKCGTSLGMHMNQSLILGYSINTRNRCTKEYLMSKVKKIYELSPINLILVIGKNITMTLMLSHQLIPSYNVLMRSTYYCTRFIQVNRAMVDNCPRIPIATLDVDRKSTYISTERNGTLCVDEYFTIMRSLSNNQDTVHMHIIMFIITVLICIFSMY